MLNGSGDVQPGEFNFSDLTPKDASEVPSEITLDDVLECSGTTSNVWSPCYGKSGDTGTSTVLPNTTMASMWLPSLVRWRLGSMQDERTDDASLGWDAVKDVVTGEAAYRARHPVSSSGGFASLISFSTARLRSMPTLTMSNFWTSRCLRLAKDFPIAMHDIERLLYTTWH